MHSSDWHIGRRFHGSSLDDELGVVLDALTTQLSEQAVDVLLVSGDIFDHSTPSAAAYQQLDRVLHAIHALGVTIVLISGNHDSATRLGFQSGFAATAGVHVLSDSSRVAVPVELSDDDGPVLIYGIPFLEPVLLRRDDPDAGVRNQAQAMQWAMEQIRSDIAERTVRAGTAPRTVVLSHSFVAGVSAGDSERDIAAGGLDVVPLSTCDGVDYVALGHLHSPAVLAWGVRYSGAPVHYSFTEAGRGRGTWIVDLDGSGLNEVRWCELPVPRPLVTLTGTIDDLCQSPDLADAEDSWVRVILTDPIRPLDAMRRIQARFSHAVVLEHRPPQSARAEPRYVSASEQPSDHQVISDFLSHVRDGAGPDEAEAGLIAEVLEQLRSGGSA